MFIFCLVFYITATYLFVMLSVYLFDFCLFNMWLPIDLLLLYCSLYLYISPVGSKDSRCVMNALFIWF